MYTNLWPLRVVTSHLPSHHKARLYWIRQVSTQTYIVFSSVFDTMGPGWLSVKLFFPWDSHRVYQWCLALYSIIQVFYLHPMDPRRISSTSHHKARLYWIQQVSTQTYIVFSAVFDMMGPGWFYVKLFFFQDSRRVYQWSLSLSILIQVFHLPIYIQQTLVASLLPPTTRLICIKYDKSLDTIVYSCLYLIHDSGHVRQLFQDIKTANGNYWLSHCKWNLAEKMHYAAMMVSCAHPRPLIQDIEMYQ